MTDEFMEWGVEDNTGRLIAEVESREECVEIVEDLIDCPLWNDLAPFTIVDLSVKNQYKELSRAGLEWSFVYCQFAMWTVPLLIFGDYNANLSYSLQAHFDW